MVVMEMKSLLRKSLQRENKHNLMKGLNTVVVLTCVLRNVLHEKSLTQELCASLCLSTVYACIGDIATTLKTNSYFCITGGLISGLQCLNVTSDSLSATLALKWSVTLPLCGLSPAA